MKKTSSQLEAQIQAQVVLLENEIISRSVSPDQYRLINNQYNRLQSWHDQHTGWRIYRTPASVRLLRTPVSFVQGYVFRNLRQPRDFACFVWTLWYAETRQNEGGGHANSQQFLMSQLAERLEEHSATGYLAPHVAPFDFKRQSDRYSLFHALKALEALGGLHLEDGSSEEWVNQSGQENALYEFTEVTRSLILALDMEQVRVAGRALDGNPNLLAPARLPGMEKIAPLQRAWRTLLLGPALLKYDDPEAFAALRQHQETFQFEVGQTYGWQLDLRYEYAMIIRPSGTGQGPYNLLNVSGAADQAVLLCCQLVRQKIEKEWRYPATEGCFVVPEGEIAEVFRQIREAHGSRWGSTARKTSFQELLEDVYGKLRLAGLMRGPDRSGHVLILPTMARFQVSYFSEEEADPPQSNLEKTQQLAFEPAGFKKPGPTALQSAPRPGSKLGSKESKETAGYNTVEAGRVLGVSQQSISRWLKTGFLKGEMVGRAWLIPQAELARINEFRQGTPLDTTTASKTPSDAAAAQPEAGVQPENKATRTTKTTKVDLDDPGRGYNTYQAARLLGVTDSTILNWLRKGKIEGEKKGSNWSIPPGEIERLKAQA